MRHARKNWHELQQKSIYINPDNAKIYTSLYLCLKPKKYWHPVSWHILLCCIKDITDLMAIRDTQILYQLRTCTHMKDPKLGALVLVSPWLSMSACLHMSRNSEQMYIKSDTGGFW